MKNYAYYLFTQTKMKFEFNINSKIYHSVQSLSRQRWPLHTPKNFAALLFRINMTCW